MFADEPVTRDDIWFSWLVEGKSGIRWCVCIAFFAWQLQLASLIGCDFIRFHFDSDSALEDDHYLSVGFFRRATHDSMTAFEGSICMLYEDLEKEVYQSKPLVNCGIAGFCLSSVALLYLILAMFGVVRHKTGESYCLAVFSIIAGLLMSAPQNFGDSDACDTKTYSEDGWIEANPELP